jgi:hypothetical protein
MSAYGNGFGNAYEDAFNNCYYIAAKFDEFENKLLDDCQECIRRQLNRKFTKPVVYSIFFTTAAIGGIISYLSGGINLPDFLSSLVIGGNTTTFNTVLTGINIGFWIGIFPASFLGIYELAHTRRDVIKRAKQLKGIVREWKVAVKQLRKASRSSGKTSDEYWTLTSAVDEYIRAFNGRYSQWNKYVAEAGKTAGEHSLENFSEKAGRIALVAGLGVATVGLGAVIGGLKNGMGDFGSSAPSGGTTWINKETGEETDYDPRI